MLQCVFRVEPAALPPDPSSCVGLRAAERGQARALRFPPRRYDWLRGRRAAKEAVARVMRERWGAGPPLADLVIEAEPGGAPCVRLSSGASEAGGFAPGQRLPVAVTISHRAGAVFCAAAAVDEVAGLLGADLELIEPRSAAFAADFFRDEEIAACAQSEGLVAVVWSAKEAVLKALRLGLTVDTRSLVCVPETSPAGQTDLVIAGGDGWRTFRLLERPPGTGDRPLACLWRARGPFVQTLAFGRPGLRARGAA
jgi:4'-phosphopantetheinyl transferase